MSSVKICTTLGEKDHMDLLLQCEISRYLVVLVVMCGYCSITPGQPGDNERDRA